MTAVSQSLGENRGSMTARWLVAPLRYLLLGLGQPLSKRDFIVWGRIFVILLALFAGTQLVIFLMSGAAFGDDSTQCWVDNGENGATTCQPITPTTYHPNASCEFGPYLANTVAQGMTYSALIYKSLSGQVTGATNTSSLLNIFMLIWANFFAMKLMLFPRQAGEAWTKALFQIVLYIVVSFFLHSNTAIFQWVFNPLQSTAANTAAYIINTGQTGNANGGQTDSNAGAIPLIVLPSNIATACDAAAQSAISTQSVTDSGQQGVITSYLKLWSNVENTVFPLLVVGFNRSKWNIIGPSDIVTFIEWAIILLPFLFVMGVFAAYLMQAFFYFLAVAGLSPLLLALTIFEKTRPFMIAGLRLCLSGSLTIITAGVALGFSSMLINQAVSKLNSVSAIQNPLTDWTTLSLFLSGCISILLHMLAPRVAANISGAQDSAATAAGVTAAGQFLVAKGLMMGKGGVGTAASGLSNAFSNSLISRFGDRMNAE